MRRALARRAEALWLLAMRGVRLHEGTFDGWCWAWIALGAAHLADKLDPIPGRR